MTSQSQPSGLQITAQDGVVVSDVAGGSAESAALAVLASGLSGALTFIGAVTVDLIGARVVEVVMPISPHRRSLVLAERDGACWWANGRMGAAGATFDLDLDSGPAVVTGFDYDAAVEPHAGVVHIWSGDPGEWAQQGMSAPIGLPKDRVPRVLVLVHGMFGSTVADFGLLGATNRGIELFDACVVEYDAVIGFDHDTVTATPQENAAQLRQLLGEWSVHGIDVDAIAIGRGAVVLQHLHDGETDVAQHGIEMHVAVVIEEPVTADTNRAGLQIDGKTRALLAASRRALASPGSASLASTMLNAGLTVSARAVAKEERTSPTEAVDAASIGAGSAHVIPGDSDVNDPVLGQPYTAIVIGEWLGLDGFEQEEMSAGSEPDSTGGHAGGQPGVSREGNDRPPKRGGGSRGDRGDAHDQPLAQEPPGRVVQAVVIHDGVRRHSFVAGEPNILRVWIGPPPTSEEAVAATDTPVPELGTAVDLVVELSVGLEVVDCQPLLLPSGSTARSGDCDLAVQPDAGELILTGELAFTVDCRMFEFVQVQGRVLAADESELPGERLKLVSRIKRRQVVDLSRRTSASSSIVVDNDDDRGPLLRKFGPTGSGAFDVSGKATLVDFLADNLFVTTKRLIRRREEEAKQQNTTYAPYTDVADEDWTELLRTAAKHGWLLHRSLINQGFEDPGDRIEVINLQPNEYLPLEFIYDRGAPADDAKVRVECMTAMADGSVDCGHCTSYGDLTLDERDANPTLCPFGFWSLRKVIERHGVAKDGAISSSAPTDEVHTIDDLSAVLCGWSVKIRDHDVAGLRAEMQRNAPGVSFATDWADWKNKLKTNPSLMVVLPHQEKDDRELARLEMGGMNLGIERELRQYVQTKSNRPILILLGCETDDSDSLGHPSFARAFNAMGAPIVIATLSKVVGRHAGPFANKLVAELVAANNDGVDIGQVLLDVRRKMFASGYLMALGVIALGDGDWKVHTNEGIA